MAFALIFILLSTLVGYGLLARAHLLPKTPIFSLVLAWTVGQFIAAWTIFALSLALAPLTRGVLLKASLLCLPLLVGLLIPLRRELSPLAAQLQGRLTGEGAITAALIGLCFAFAFRFYWPHLQYVGGAIYTSPPYWDFNIHFPIIQTFVHGDNFPPQNESFAGIPITYHYFYDFLTAIYAAGGLDLVGAMNFLSMASLGMLLVGVLSAGQEYLHSLRAGVVAVLLVVTSSSLRFLTDLSPATGVPFWTQVHTLLTNQSHPFFFSYLEGHAYGYDGTMYNLFFFLAERQMLFAVLYLLTALHLLTRVGSMGTMTGLAVGAGLGLFFQWHLFATISVGAALGLLSLVYLREKRLLPSAVGFAVLFIVQAVYFKWLSANDWFLPTLGSYPRLNFDFSSFPPDYPLSVPNFLLHYGYGYGVKLLAFALGLRQLVRQGRDVTLPLVSLILPTFVLLNTVQLSPLSVYDNHKWLRPMNVLVDLVAAYYVYSLLVSPWRWKQALAAPLLALLMLSGVIELIPFLNARPSTLYAAYPTNLMQTVRAQTEPRAVFVSPHAKELHLAGRKLFLSDPGNEPGALSWVAVSQLDTEWRQRIVNTLTLNQGVDVLCTLVETYGIDYLEVASASENPLLTELAAFPRLDATDETGRPTTFVHVSSGCRAPSGAGAPGQGGEGLAETRGR